MATAESALPQLLPAATVALAGFRDLNGTYYKRCPL
jgi:hypothetical protein